MAAVSDEGVVIAFGLLHADISCSVNDNSAVVGTNMASVAPDPPTARGAARPRQLLPLGEIKSLFIKFLEQQGYAVPQEADDLLEDVVSNNSRQNRSQSPCPFVASSGKRSSSAIS
ncbi:hypothetical protein EVAR_98679_1 [Eumeta japonica]|uniref:Uncharacterized protein n=1 Tax=Eumeta variegata TaxID=151549 RepID=A0A4C1XY65_EUMVA|nr:hypothetical protein EVAR_98679_1 [Eumeta japonica]